MGGSWSIARDSPRCEARRRRRGLGRDDRLEKPAPGPPGSLWRSIAGAVHGSCPGSQSKNLLASVYGASPAWRLVDSGEHPSGPDYRALVRTDASRARALTPRICRQPKARSGAPAPRLCDGVGAAGRPRDASTKRGAPSAPRGVPPAPPFLANISPAQCLQAEWRHGVGRHARQMRGERVRTCKDLLVRSKPVRA
jgi:hypothetical protein